MPPPAEVIEFTAAADAPPITMGPGGLPVKSVMSAGRGTMAGESKLNAARENPARTVLRSCGEKTWVSCALMTWLRSNAVVPKRPFIRGERLYPSSTVYAVESVSLVLAFRSNRAVPKSSRIVCTGWLKSLAIPVAKPFANCWGPLGAGHTFM